MKVTGVMKFPLLSTAPGLGPNILNISHFMAIFSQIAVLFLSRTDLQILQPVLWAYFLTDVSFREPHTKMNSGKLGLNFIKECGKTKSYEAKMLLSLGDYTLKCHCSGGSQLSLFSVIILSSYKTLVLKVFFKYDLTDICFHFLLRKISFHFQYGETEAQNSQNRASDW